MRLLFVLGVDVICDIGHVFVMWQTNSDIDHGNKTLDSYIMEQCMI